jgi:uncharacterized protein (DUF433 family)
VPVQTLIGFLETGKAIDGFLAVYPYIRRERVHAYLELSNNLAIEQLACESSQMGIDPTVAELLTGH